MQELVKSCFIEALALQLCKKGIAFEIPVRKFDTYW